MLAALKELHPLIGTALKAEVDLKVSDRDKAKALFRGMFERSSNNVQKGAFAQALAAQIEDNDLDVVIPAYIENAILHVCKP